jgi:hypothetical protein
MQRKSQRATLHAVVAASFIALSLAASPAAAQTWIGGGADNNWSTGANWSGGVAPASGPTTQLVFPSGSARTTPVVDAPWTVNHLDFSIAGYSLSGQTLTFDGINPGITITGAFITVSNPIVLAAPFSVSGSGDFVTFNGPVSGPGSLTAGGLGGTILAGIHTFTGGVNVGSAHAFALAGSIPGPVTVSSAATFSGSGTVTGAVTVTGGGGLNLTAPLSTGPLTVGAGSFVTLTISGTAAGQFGTVSVAGAVDITGASLNLSGPYVPVPGDVFTFIVNDGADPVAGAFAGLPEGATVTFNGVPLRISYVGGTGNDVTLSATAAATAPLQVPTLSQWALILLASVVAGVGMVRVHRAG